MKGKKPLKVLMTTDTVGGVWTYTIELCKALVPHNVHISLVSTGARLAPWQWEEVIAIGNVKVYETDYLLEWMENPWRDIDESGDYLLKLEEEIQPDVVHLNCFAYGSLNWKSPVVMVAHSDVYSWHISVKNDDPSADWNEYYFRVKSGLNHADMVVAPSHAMMESIDRIYSFSTDKKIIYNARQQNLFTRGIKQPTVVSMGRKGDEAKNVNLLIDAAGLINYPIKIAGENSIDSNVVDSKHNNVEYLGNLNTGSISKVLSTASVFVLPAKYEPFGLSALEAALSGCALVLGDIPSLKEVWKDNAIYVDTEDSKALAKTINELMENQSLLEEYALKAFTQAQQYNPAKMANGYLQVYKHLVNVKENAAKKSEASYN